MTASPLNTDASVEVRKAVRFFWAWLILATSLSIAGNVTHAILKAPEGAVILAAVAAVVAAGNPARLNAFGHSLDQDTPPGMDVRDRAHAHDRPSRLCVRTVL